MCPALADDVERGRVLRVRRFDPRFDRDCIAICEIEPALRAFVRNHNLRTRAVESGGFVSRRELRKSRRPRPLIDKIEIPTRDGRKLRSDAAGRAQKGDGH